MVKVKIYGLEQFSTCTKRVIVVCNELGIEYDLEKVDVRKMEHKLPEYMSKHPFGMIPAMEDDGVVLYESRAICRYLTAKYGMHTGLLPDMNDLGAYGLFEQAASIECCSFDPPAGGLTYERLLSRSMGSGPDEYMVAKHIETLKSKMDGYERILSKQRYLAGDEITLADLFHLPYGAYLNRVEPDIMGSKPGVKRWWEEISSRPSWQSME